MGFPPPPDGPSVPTQIGFDLSLEFVPPHLPTFTIGGSVGIGFTDPLPVIALCLFTLPIFGFALSFTIPTLSFPPPLPDFGLSFGINCLISNPLSITAKSPFGGGRVSKADIDVDDSFDQAA
jgi:hypothetical protein